MAALLGGEAVDAGQGWPVAGGWTRPRPELNVLAVCRNHRAGIEAGVEFAKQWASGSLKDSRLLGILIVDDGPKLLDAQKRATKKLGQMTPHGWHLPWIEEWRISSPDTQRLAPPHQTNHEEDPVTDRNQGEEIMFDLIASGANTLASLPNPNPEQPPGTDGFTTLLNWIAWGVIVLGLAGFLASAGYLAFASFTGPRDQRFQRIGHLHHRMHPGHCSRQHHGGIRLSNAHQGQGVNHGK